jgi:hypothetical protein
VRSREVSEPILLARDQFFRVLNELDRRKAAIPGPNTFDRHTGEEGIAFSRLRLDLEEDRVPARSEDNSLIGPLSQERGRRQNRSKSESKSKTASHKASFG